jgi:hypothetical protein
MRFLVNVFLLVSIFFGCNSARLAQSEDPNTVAIENQGASSTSPYSIWIEQPDGTRLEVIGKGNMNTPYTETVDGYTILLNKEGIYEYAILGNNGKLKPSGLQARNSENRSGKDKKFLKTLNKHLRNQSN